MRAVSDSDLNPNIRYVASNDGVIRDESGWLVLAIASNRCRRGVRSRCTIKYRALVLCVGILTSCLKPGWSRYQVLSREIYELNRLS